jgi:hypothetical protein
MGAATRIAPGARIDAGLEVQIARGFAALADGSRSSDARHGFMALGRVGADADDGL